MKLLATLLLTFTTQAAELSFEKNVKPIMVKNCKSCHATAEFPDVTQYSVAFEKRFEIQRRVEDRSMPYYGKLTQEEIRTIVRWVEQGAFK